MKMSVGTNVRRQTALTNLEKHLGNHRKEHMADIEPMDDEAFKAHDAKQKAETKVLAARIKDNAKFRKYLKRKPPVKAAIEAAPTPA